MANGSSPNLPAPRLRVRVEELKRHGASVTVLGSGEKAWLPATEHTPGIKPKEDFSRAGVLRQGEELEVVRYEERVKGSQHAHTLVSHIRATDRDPWEQALSWPDGATKTMEVTLVTGTHAFGVVPPGVRARVPLAPLRALFRPPWLDFSVLSCGDMVSGIVRADQIDIAQRVLTLDVPALIQSEISVETALSPGLRSGRQLPNDNHLLAAYGTAGRHGVPAIGRILFVDDDRMLGQSVRSYLAPLGCEVIVYESEREALAALEGMQAPCDLFIVDIHLSARSDYSGLKVLAKAQAENPGVPAVLITGDDTALSRPLAAEHRDLRVHDLIFKPFGIEELERAIGARNALPQALSQFWGPPDEPPRPRASQPSDPADDIQSALRDLAAQVKAECTVLFSLHPVSMRVGIVESHDPCGLVPAVKPNIERSPISDVALEGEVVCEVNAGAHAAFRKHRWLRRAYTYRSCLGVPVRFPSELVYGLFCFHRENDRFRQDDIPQARNAARVVASVLHARRLEGLLRDVEPYELLGKAYGSMAHDLKGILSVELSLDPLLQSLAAKQTLDRSELAAVRDTILALGDRLRRAADIVKTFRLVARGAQDEEKDVNLFDSVSASVRLLADQHRQIRRQLAVANHFDSNCLVRLRPMALHQLLFNLALNAVQQTERFPPRRPFGGEIVVELGLECLPDGKWAIIRVHDTGPGIHHADLERIFEVGFSTKEDGFGMGLDICRRIGRQVSNGARHGSVTVARSIMFVGSVFEVRLPVPSSAAPRA